MEDSEEHLLSLETIENYRASCSPQPNVSENSSISRPGLMAPDEDSTVEIPPVVPAEQLPSYCNVMIKPIAPKHQSTSVLPNPHGVVFRPLPQQSHILHQQPYMSSPILHPSPLPPTCTCAPSLSIATAIAPPAHSVPLLTSHNPTKMTPSASSSYNTTSSSKLQDKSGMSGSPSQSGGGGGLSANKPRKPCNCKNSQCLKLYCDCFANGEFCRESCNCQNCKNSRQHEHDRTKAVKACLERNPNAFKPKVGHAQVGDSRRHIKGCNCKKSGCLKNYCECYEAKIPCSYLCRCVGCQNVSDRPEGKGLMELANAADIRTQQQRAASGLFPEQIANAVYNHKPTDGHKLPYAFVNKDITKATALCLLEEASHAASSGQTCIEVEKAVLIEFGRCLEQIINSSESANQSIRESIGIV